MDVWFDFYIKVYWFKLWRIKVYCGYASYDSYDSMSLTKASLQSDFLRDDVSDADSDLDSDYGSEPTELSADFDFLLLFIEF